MTRRAGILVRISDDRTGEGLGVDRQEQDCRRVAEARGWDVVKVYRENDTSAFKRRKVRLPDGTTALRVVRPAFREVLADIDGGEITALVAYDLDRVARDPRDLEDLIDAVELRALPTAAVTGEIDLSTDNGIFMARMMVNVANKSSRDTSRRVRRAMLALAESGQVHGGARPFGYQDDRITADPEESEHVLWAYREALAGRSLRSIGIGLQERSPTRLWDVDTVRRILTSPRYAGLRQHQGKVIGEAAWEPLVDRELWEQVRAVLSDRRHPDRHVGGPRKYLLTGLLFCGRCGARLYPRRNAERQRFGCLPAASGGCGGCLVVYEPAELFIIKAFRERLASGIDLAPAEPDDPTVDLRTRLGRLEEQQRTLGEAFADDPGDALAFRAASNSLRDKAEQLRRELVEYARPRPLPSVVTAEWDDYDDAQKRAALERSIARVVIGPGRNGGPAFDYRRLTIEWR